MKLGTKSKAAVAAGVLLVVYAAWPQQLVEEMSWAIHENDAGPTAVLAFRRHPYWTMHVHAGTLVDYLKRTKPATVRATFRVSWLKNMVLGGPLRLSSLDDWKAENYTLGIGSQCGKEAPYAPCDADNSYPYSPEPFYPHWHHAP